MSIIRIKHNKENPYVQINKEALWNPRLSLKAIGLWAKCLSRPDDWTFRVNELATKGMEGRRALDSAIQELEKERYVLKLKHYNKSDTGKFSSGGVEYVFFEFPYTDQERQECIEEFKKSFRHCCFGDCRGGNCRNSKLLNTDTTNSSSPLHSEEDRGLKKESAKPQSSSPPKIEFNLNPQIPQEASELAQKLLERVKAIHPKLKAPDLLKWAQEMEKINRIENKSWEEIGALIDWAFEHDFWVKVLQSPKGLRKHWDKMIIQQAKIDNRGTVLKRNLEISQAVKQHLIKTNRGNQLWIGGDFVRHIPTGDTISMNLNSESFENALCSWFDLTKK